eukprot:scaffold279827_cov52-Attheya_sp.AAC.2
MATFPSTSEPVLKLNVSVVFSRAVSFPHPCVSTPTRRVGGVCRYLPRSVVPIALDDRFHPRSPTVGVSH